MNQFFKELHEGTIDLHDSWQIELETAIASSSLDRNGAYTQEFYFFLPSSLQITEETYSKENFYSDCTNFIRKKTPDISLDRLVEEIGLEDQVSLAYEYIQKSSSSFDEAKNGLLLLTNIFRAAVRKQTHDCFQWYVRITSKTSNKFDIEKLKEELGDAVANVEKFIQIWDRKIIPYLLNRFPEFHKDRESIDISRRYISTSIDIYFSALFQQIESLELDGLYRITELLQSEKRYRIDHFQEPPTYTTLQGVQRDIILYERGAYEKFIRSILFFSLDRKSLSDRFAQIVASIAAGLAAFLYLTILFWKSSYLAVNSMTFILLSTFLYMMKDRLKDGVKSLFQRKAGRFFDDFRTRIFVPSDVQKSKEIGSVQEYFMFLRQASVPEDIVHIRTSGTELLLTAQERRETVLYYRKKIVSTTVGGGFFQSDVLHTIFRLNLRALFEKSSDPTEEISTYDAVQQKVIQIVLPKIYHVNVIIKTVQKSAVGETVPFYQKYRLYVDKTGIKGVDRLFEGIHVV